MNTSESKSLLVSMTRLARQVARGAARAGRHSFFLVLFSLLLSGCALTRSVNDRSPAEPEETAVAVEESEAPAESGAEAAAPVEADEVEISPDAGEVAIAEGEPLAEVEPEPRPSPRDPCQVMRPDDESRLDQYRREIFETVCEAAAQFDSFFGNQRFDEEARRTHGRAGLQVVYDEHEGIELDGRLRVNVDFPNLDSRVNAFLGREPRDEFIGGVENDLDFLPTFFGREGNEEWLIGLGYRPVSNDRSSLDFDVGVDVDSGVDPFARTRYRRYWLVGDDNLLRARQTVYYSNDKGVGYGTRLDFERPFGERTLARWTGNIRFDDETDGGDWNSGITMYHGFTPDRALAWFIGIDGETGREVPIQDYGTRVTYRQRMLREWFFGELITGVTWPRDNLQMERELAWHVGFGFEIQFSGEDLFMGR